MLCPDVADALDQTRATAPSLGTDSRFAKTERLLTSIASQSILYKEPLCARPRFKLSFPSLCGGKCGVKAVIGDGRRLGGRIVDEGERVS